jgi:nitroreductase
MEFFKTEWQPAIELRRAVRAFDGKPLRPQDLAHLKKFAAEAAPVKGARAVVIPEGALEVFKGMEGAYGGIQNCQSFAVFIADTRVADAFTHLGFLGEALVLDAVCRGVSTCWVGGTYRPEVAGRFSQIGSGEKIAAVAALGYAPGPAVVQAAQLLKRPRSRKALADLVSGMPLKALPAWMLPSLEAARMAPSHLNRQPVRFEASEKSVVVKFEGPENEDGVSKRLECGIAMLHFETVARAEGRKGNWEYSNAAGEAGRYVV